MSSHPRLPVPDRKDLLNPLFLVRWISWFVRGWFGTRNYQALRFCIPFMLLLTGLLVLIALSRQKPEVYYQKVLKDASAANDSVTAEVALRRLIQLSPNNESYLFQLAEFHLENGDHAAAYRLLNTLAPFSREAKGFSRAHAKMVELGVDPQSEIPVSVDRRLFHVKRLLEEKPDSKKLNRVIAGMYLDLDQPRLAEPYLAKVCGDSAQLMLIFSRVESQLGKAKNAQRAAEFATKMASEEFASSNDLSSAILLSKAMLLQGKEREAEQILVKVGRQEPEASRQALVDFYTSLAARRFKQSRLFRQEAAEIVARGLKLSPTDQPAADLLCRLIDAGASVPELMKDQLAEAWSELAGGSEPDGRTLFTAARVLRSCGQTEAALKWMKLATEVSPEFTEVYAQMLIEQDQPTEAALVLTTLLTCLNDDGEPTVIRRAVVHRMLGEYKESIRQLRTFEEPSTLVRKELARTLVASLDEEQGWEECLSTLKEALDVRPTDANALARVGALAAESPEARKVARQLVLSKVSAGELPAGRAYAALGTASSLAGDYESAAKDLLEAKRLAEKQGTLVNPIILNNLATALLRKVEPDPDAARAAVDEALQIVPGQIDLIITKAEVLAAASNWSDVVETLVPVLRRRSGDQTVNGLLAKAYSALGNAELAEEHRRSLKSD